MKKSGNSLKLPAKLLLMIKLFLQCCLGLKYYPNPYKITRKYERVTITVGTITEKQKKCNKKGSKSQKEIRRMRKFAAL